MNIQRITENEIISRQPSLLPVEACFRLQTRYGVPYITYRHARLFAFRPVSTLTGISGVYLQNTSTIERSWSRSSYNKRLSRFLLQKGKIQHKKRKIATRHASSSATPHLGVGGVQLSGLKKRVETVSAVLAALSPHLPVAPSPRPGPRPVPRKKDENKSKP